MVKKIFKKLLSTLITIVILGLIGGGGLLVWKYQSNRTIGQLLEENKELQEAITNLKSENQIGYAKVISQVETEGKIITKLKFVETDREDMLKRVLEKEYEMEGDIIHFDALIVKFDEKLVIDGKERALYLWRRVYSSKMRPEDGFAIETQGDEPKRYADISSSKLNLKDKSLFWKEIWKLADDKESLAEYGVSAIYGNVVYHKVQPGLVYVFKISSTGSLYPEVIPDL
ncbi:MAG: hypothetical protein ACYTBV_11205 [Planctomycetota bacterium]|jgi:hypothetical protein